MSAKHANAVSTRRQLWALLRRLALYFCIAAAFTAAYSAYILRDNARAAYELVFHYEQAASGLTPNGTRLIISQLKSEPVLVSALERVGLDSACAPELAARLSISPIENDSGVPSLTRYLVTYEGDLWQSSSALDTVSANAVAEAVLLCYRDTFYEQYILSPAAPDIDWETYSTLEYWDAGRFLAGQGARLARFLQNEEEKFGAEHLTADGESFAGLKLQVANLLNVELENYDSFVLQSGLAKNTARLVSVLQKWDLLQDLTGGASTMQSSQSAAFLHRLQAETATEADTGKAQQMLDQMQQTLAGICADAAALHEQAAAQRMQEAVTLTYRPGLTAGWSTDWALLTGAALFFALCAASLVRSAKKGGRHEKH